MTALSVKPEARARYDIVSLGEVMLRLDPGERRIHTTRRFDVWEGGGEYNVARGLRRCFGRRAAIVTALADNPVGRLVEDLILQGGVDTSHLVFKSYDGIGETVRNGLNFVERGFGARAAVGCSDRGHTAIGQLRLDEIDRARLFDAEGTRWLHTGGIFAALGSECPRVAETLMDHAHETGALVSYDLNFRPSLWRARGGQSAAQAVNRRLVDRVDVLFGNEEDFSACLGFETEGTGSDFTDLHPDAFRNMIRRVSERYPRLKIIATSLRTAQTASRNLWGAICFDATRGEFFEVPQQSFDIFDRVGGGDSFASGVIEGILSGWDIGEALRCGVAHGALAMTTPGDTTMVRREEVLRLMAGGGARIDR